MPGATSLPGVVVRDLALERRRTPCARSRTRPSCGRSVCAAHLAVVHEVFHLDRRHQDFGVRERRRACPALIRPLMWSPWKCEMMTMSTALRSMPAAFRLVDGTGRRRPCCARSCASPVPVSISDELGAGVDDDRRVRDRHHVLFHVSGEQRLVHLVLLDVEDEGVRRLEGVAAVGDDGDLDARRPCSGTSPAPAWWPRRRGEPASWPSGVKRGRGGSRGGAGKHITSCQIVHAFLPGDDVFDCGNRLPRTPVSTNSSRPSARRAPYRRASAGIGKLLASTDPAPQRPGSASRTIRQTSGRD